MTLALLPTIRDIIQEDVGRRGLRTDPEHNLITACVDDFAAACESVAAHPAPSVAIVTGFYIPDGHPPAGETDGPLGAVFLARCLAELGIRVALLTDGFCRAALAAGLRASGLEGQVALLALPALCSDWDQFISRGWLPFASERFRLTHLIAIERPGPSHTLDSFQKQHGCAELVGLDHLRFLDEVPATNQDRCHAMSGKDITVHVSPAHLLFESIQQHLPAVITIGIGDGGNEIGMGKIPWEIIRRNIPGGGRIACRVPTDFLLVCGVSNWGAYGLGAGVMLLRGRPLAGEIFSADRERAILEEMVKCGPLIDGITKLPSLSVDGLTFDRYAEPLRHIAALAARGD